MSTEPATGSRPHNTPVAGSDHTIARHPVAYSSANPFVTEAQSDQLRVFVAGHAAPQGSKRHVGGGVLVESSKRVRPWRTDVREALCRRSGQPLRVFPGAVSVGIEFIMPRPKSGPRSKPGAHCDGPPDLDKMARAVLDGLESSGVITNDSRVVQFHRLAKRLADPGETPGAYIEIRSM